MRTLPCCTPERARKVERCIRQVKARVAASGGDVNPWAVCQARIGCAIPRGRGRPGVMEGLVEDMAMASEMANALRGVSHA